MPRSALGVTLRSTLNTRLSLSPRFGQAMVATGASAAVPPVPGLKDMPHLTNSNFWNLEALPPRMGVIGAGPIGLEMSQAMQRFGCKVWGTLQRDGGLRLSGPERPSYFLVFFLFVVVTNMGRALSVLKLCWSRNDRWQSRQ